MRSDYLICGTPRTGGNTLCDVLQQIRIGRPDEYVHPDVVRDLLDQWKIPASQYRERLFSERSARGVFGAKVHWLERK